MLKMYRDLKSHPPQGMLDVVPAFTELAVHFDPVETDRSAIRSEVEERFLQVESRPDPETNGTLHCLDVVYDGSDLERVAQYTGFQIDEVIRRHTAPMYLVSMIGFLPHFPYCLGLDAGLATPRLPSPRERVPAGSVAIAGMQTGIYPRACPGGWNLLGHTDPNALLPIQPGDRLKFSPAGGGA